MNTKRTRLLAGITDLTLFAVPAFADTVEAGRKPLTESLLMSVIFASAAMALLFVAFKLFDWATPRIDIQKELLNNNIAVAIMTAAVILGVSLIVAVSIM